MKAKLKKTTGCLPAVDEELRKQNESPLSRADSKDPDAYRDLSERFAKKKDVTEAARHNPGFSRFVEQLELIEAAWRASS